MFEDKRMTKISWMEVEHTVCMEESVGWKVWPGTEWRPPPEQQEGFPSSSAPCISWNLNGACQKERLTTTLARAHFFTSDGVETHLPETQSWVFSASDHYHVCFETTHLGNLAHFINVGLLLFEFGECGLYGSDDHVVVCSRARGREPTGVVEPGNVNGRGRWGDYQRRRRRARWARRGGGSSCSWVWWGCPWFLLWFGLDLRRTTRQDQVWKQKARVGADSFDCIPIMVTVDAPNALFKTKLLKLLLQSFSHHISQPKTKFSLFFF